MTHDHITGPAAAAEARAELEELVRTLQKAEGNAALNRCRYEGDMELGADAPAAVEPACEAVCEASEKVAAALSALNDSIESHEGMDAEGAAEAYA